MRPSRQIVANGQTLVFITDYLSGGNIAIQIVPSGGASVAVAFTADDVNDLTVTPTWILPPAPFNVAITANVFANLPLFPIRALQFIVTVGGSAAITILQSSGSPDIGPEFV